MQDIRDALTPENLAMLEVIAEEGSFAGAARQLEVSVPAVHKLIRALEGALVPIPCLEDASGTCCTRAPECATRPVWALVRTRLAETLDNLTLADVCSQEIDVRR